MKLKIELKYNRKEITREEHVLLYGTRGDEYMQDPELAKYYKQEKVIAVASELSLPEQIALTQLALTGLVNMYEKQLIK